MAQVRTGAENDLDGQSLYAKIDGTFYALAADSCVLKVAGAGFETTIDLTGYCRVSGLALRLERDRRERVYPEYQLGWRPYTAVYGAPTWPTCDEVQA